MKTWIAMAGLLCIAALPTKSAAQTAKPQVTMNEIGTLAGHKAMSLHVEVDEATIQRETQSRMQGLLKILGITVLPGDQLPALVVETHTMRSNGGQWVYTVAVQFVLRAAYPDAPTKTFVARSWSSERMGFFPAGAWGNFREALDRSIDDFASAYRKANGSGPAQSTETRLKSTDIPALRAANGKLAVTVGRVTRIQQGREWLLYLESPGEVFVAVSSGRLRDDLLRAEMRGESLVGKTIAARGDVISAGTHAIRINLASSSDALEVVP